MHFGEKDGCISDEENHSVLGNLERKNKKGFCLFYGILSDFSEDVLSIFRYST